MTEFYKKYKGRNTSMIMDGAGWHKDKKYLLKNTKKKDNLELKLRGENNDKTLIMKYKDNEYNLSIDAEYQNIESILNKVIPELPSNNISFINMCRDIVSILSNDFDIKRE